MTNKTDICDVLKELDAALLTLQAVRQFIINGVDLGFIRMPDADTPDPAHETLPMIDGSIADLRGLLENAPHKRQEHYETGMEAVCGLLANQSKPLECLPESGAIKYHFIDTPQTVEYDTLHCLEIGMCQAIHMRGYLNKKGRGRNTRQISKALGRLKARGLVKYEYGQWLPAWETAS